MCVLLDRRHLLSLQLSVAKEKEKRNFAKEKRKEYFRQFVHRSAGNVISHSQGAHVQKCDVRRDVPLINFELHLLLSLKEATSPSRESFENKNLIEENI